MGYSPWGCKESDTTERLHIHMLGIHADSQHLLQTKNQGKDRQRANSGAQRSVGSFGCAEWSDNGEVNGLRHLATFSLKILTFQRCETGG